MKYIKSFNLIALLFLSFSQGIKASQECKPEFWGQIGKTEIFIAKGDITKLKNVDAIVNAANEDLQHWDGVAGAISKASHSSQELPQEYNNKQALLTELQLHSDKMKNFCNSDKKCPEGQAVITPPFGLEKNGIKWIIHAVGPRGTNQDKKRLLECAYYNSAHVALDYGLKSIAFPAISTNLFGYDINEATPVAFEEIKKFILEKSDKGLSKIIFVLFSDKDYDVYKNNAHVLFGSNADDVSGKQALPKASDIVRSKDETDNAVQNSTSFAFKKFFSITIPVSLLGLLIWHFWRNAAK